MITDDVGEPAGIAIQRYSSCDRDKRQARLHGRTTGLTKH